MVSFKLMMKGGIRFFADIIRQVPQPLDNLPDFFQAPIKVAFRFMEQGLPRAMQGMARAANTTEQTDDQAESPELFSTAMAEQSLDPDAPEPRNYTIDELLTTVIENDIQLPEPTPLTETDVHRPGQPLLNEHGVPQVFPRGMSLEDIKAKADRLKESDLPDKAFAGLRAKPSEDKKPIAVRDRVIDHYSSGEEADSGDEADSDDEADSGGDESGPAGPISLSDDAVYSYLKQHHPAHLAALSTQTEAEAQYATGRHDALVARIDELVAAGRPTTVAGPRYIDDYGRTLDVDLMTPASPTPPTTLPPPNGPPKGPNDKKQAKTKKKNEKRKEKRDAARMAKASSSAIPGPKSSRQEEAIKENETEKEEAEMAESVGVGRLEEVEVGPVAEDSGSEYSQEGM
jgi:hypothetical protein